MFFFHTQLVGNDIQQRQITIEAGSVGSTPLPIEMMGRQSSVFVHVCRGAKATIFDISSSAEHFVHVELEPESELRYISLSTSSVRCLTSDLASGASMHWHCTTLGDTDQPHTLISSLRGRDARSDVDWIFAVRGDEKQTVSVRNVFDAQNGGGEITMKGIAANTAFASCDGMIEITEKGKGTNTYLTQNVLMLDPAARVDAVPGLEIRTNDVKASHSATVSRLTAEDLFYMRSRGIDEVTARTMFVDGFLGSLVEKIVDPEIRRRVLEAIAA